MITAKIIDDTLNWSDSYTKGRRVINYAYLTFVGESKDCLP